MPVTFKDLDMKLQLVDLFVWNDCSRAWLLNKKQRHKVWRCFISKSCSIWTKIMWIQILMCPDPLFHLDNHIFITWNFE